MIDPLDLHAYVDGELSPERAGEVRSTLDESPEAAREAEAIRSLKKMLAGKRVDSACEEAWAGCIKRLDEVDRAKDGAKSKRIESIVARFAPGLCVVLLGVILIVPRLHHHDPGVLVTRDFARIDGGLSKTPAPTRKDMDFESWLKDRIKRSYSSTPDKLTIRGMKSGWLDGVGVTQFECRDQQGDLKLYRIEEPLILKGTRQMDDHPDLMAGNLNGVNCVVRNDGPATIIVVAPRPFEDLANVAAQVTTR